MGVVPMQPLDLYHRTMASLNGQTDGGYDFEIGNRLLDVKTSKNYPKFAFSRTNANRSKANAVAFSWMSWLHSGEGWIELMGWANKSDIQSLLRPGPNFDDLSLDAVHRAHLLFPPNTLKENANVQI